MLTDRKCQSILLCIPEIQYYLLFYSSRLQAYNYQVGVDNAVCIHLCIQISTFCPPYPQIHPQVNEDAYMLGR